jgi:hypothetical protein
MGKVQKKSDNRRAAPRKSVTGLEIKNLTAIQPFSILARKGILIDASSTGILIRVERKDLVPRTLRQNLSITPIEGEHVVFHIREMDLEMDGKVARTRFIGNSTFEIAIDFTEEAPEYWRQSLVDLLPNKGEFDEH